MTPTPTELHLAAMRIVDNGPGSRQYWESGRCIEDARDLARYVLDTVRFDDDEPVTGPRLIVLGFGYRKDGGGVLYSPCNRLRVWVDPIERWSVDSERIPEPLWPKTMGQFRALCRVLGITLTEEK
jgi:hypothetical protein